MAPASLDGTPDRASLLSELVARREELRRLKRQARLGERLGGTTAALAVGLFVRFAVMGGIFGSWFGDSSWLFVALGAAIGWAAGHGVAGAVAARHLLPARRAVSTAESRLHAHDVTYGRGR